MTYQVGSYSIENLRKVFVSQLASNNNNAKNIFADVDFNNFSKEGIHIDFFNNYFIKNNAHTILVEENYTDRDFLEDFSEYYVLCFNEYKRTCLRVHFFKHDFQKEDFEDCLGGIEHNSSFIDDIQKSYLGFIVVKPLPQTIIGKTCLQIEDVNQNYFIKFSYSVNLFGINLKVDTLPFQEQDRVTSACAASALWSTFHMTSNLFNHSILSPSKITRDASSFFPLENRVFPNGGLTPRQMARAIRNVGLEPYYIGAQNEFNFKSNLYAYLKFNIPILLGFKVPDKDKLGMHVVSVTGYSLGKSYQENYKQLPLKATRIDKIYVHDDQYGPYVEIGFEKIETSPNPSEQQINDSLNYLLRIWKCDENSKGYEAYADTIMIPLYHKIRVPFICIHNIVTRFHRFFIEKNKEDFQGPIEWDIYLIKLNEFKSNLFSKSSCVEDDIILPENIRRDLLTESLPRFLWRATVYCSDNIVLDFLFDATDFEQGKLFKYAVEYDRSFSLVLHNVFRDFDPSDPKYSEGKDIDRGLLEWLKKPSPYSQSNHLS